MKINKKPLIILLFLLFTTSLIINPEISQNAIKNGLFISANVIIPTLFPFMFCVCMIIKYGFTLKNKFINKILFKIFGHNFDMFFVFLLSLLGGYPVGASLLTELKKRNIIDEKSQNIMLTYCVNAGPAFVVSVIGVNVLGSKTIGVLLLTSHIIASFLMAVVCGLLLKRQNFKSNKIYPNTKKFAEIIVESVNTATGNILKICSFITVFFAINAYLDLYFSNIPIIKYISFFTEVTSAVYRTKNITFISFLLGFAGLSIWFQIFSICNGKKINIITFALSRVLHGGISVVITKILLNVFEIKISTYSNNISVIKNNSYSGITLSISMTIMIIVFISYLYSKNNSGKILNDVI